MKLLKIYKLVVLSLMILIFHSCSHEDKPTDSRLDYTQPVKTDLDKWIAENFTSPYNISAYYEWNQNMVDNSRYLFPPTVDKVKPALEIVKKIWVDSYTTVGGVNFVKKIAPREFVLVGGVNLNSTGTQTLGLAEGGQRISLFKVDKLDNKNRKDVTQFIHTLQHEYVHILNQQKPFNEQAWSKITPSGYTTSWYAEKEADSRNLGFITSYARLNIHEDFAETAAAILTYSKSEYETIVNNIKDPKGKAAVKEKEALVVQYYKEVFNIDFYALRDEAQKNTDTVVK
ncbi:substrate import-associated zinc metallohydrolase lipoprotein [Flavobacterium poyangense]|uniref:substrate import-associated zinc metallohydrolase lipoprotein n=1 Tax=Flavobacterium poyangense TaxID=2204302 RepID=UPI00141DFB7E|nr:substrate import-associated zinc metallohydrolase lipoprotein [Flavobacterium sp. JXAS1]